MQCVLRTFSKTRLTFGTLAMSAALNGLVNEAAWINEAKAKVTVGPAEVNAPGAGELLVKVRALFVFRVYVLCS